MRWRPARWPAGLLAVLSMVVSSAAIAGCRDESPAASSTPAPAAAVGDEASGAEAATRQCEPSRQRFVLRGAAWQSECLEDELPRTSNLWASRDGRVATLVNAGCAETDPQVLHVLEAGRVRRIPLELEHRLGRGAAIAFADADTIVITSGEDCGDATRGLLVSRVGLDSGMTTTVRHRRSSFAFWPTLFEWHGRLIAPVGFTDVFGKAEASRLVLYVLYACIHFWPMTVEGTESHCQVVDGRAGELSLAWGSGAVRGAESGPAYPVGRPTSWVFDERNERFVAIGAIDSLDRRRPGVFPFAPFAWALHERRTPRRVPIPPVVGDGVQLVYDPSREEVVLLDPGAHRSWRLEAGRWWVALEHEPLAAIAELTGSLAEGTAAVVRRARPPSRRELTPAVAPVLRHTDHVAPWFATWDPSLATFVVYPYDAAAAYCLPTMAPQGSPPRMVCVSPHP